MPLWMEIVSGHGWGEWALTLEQIEQEVVGVVQSDASLHLSAVELLPYPEGVGHAYRVIDEQRVIVLTQVESTLSQRPVPLHRR